MGGSDQWGNIVTGTELIRRKASGEAFAFTCPLIKKADGGKFGKTEKGNVWLDSERTSPYQFYQFWINASDEDAKKWIKVLTLLPKEEIEELTQAHEKEPHKRILQKKLAEWLTVFVHSRKDYEFAQKAAGILFGQETTADLKALNEKQLLEIMDGVPQIRIQRAQIEAGCDLISLLSEQNICSSKGEARQLHTAGGISINKAKADNNKKELCSEDLLQDKYILLQKGKKNYYLLITE